MIIVDGLRDRGWIMRGRRVASCHMSTNKVDLAELHAMAIAIGLRREWFQDKPGRPHYDLTAARRAAAISAGAHPVDAREFVRLLRRRHQSAQAIAEMVGKAAAYLRTEERST